MIKNLKSGQVLAATAEGIRTIGPAEDATKGDRTRSRILDQAAQLASEGGLGALTLGPLAERLGMSKSGLFAHFRSKEALQVEVLERAAERFTEQVINSVRSEPDRSKRLAIFFNNWLDWIEDPAVSGGRGGCPILASYFEFDDVPGPVRETAARQYAQFYGFIQRLVAKALPGAHEEATCAAIDGLAFSHLLRIRLMREPNARDNTMRAFEALIANPPKKEPV
jgi:AcrR family transcriptional regulator